MSIPTQLQVDAIPGSSFWTAFTSETTWTALWDASNKREYLKQRFFIHSDMWSNWVDKPLRIDARWAYVTAINPVA